MKTVLTLTVGVIALFACAYGVYMMFIILLMTSIWYSILMAYLVLAAAIGSGTLVRMINE